MEEMWEIMAIGIEHAVTSSDVALKPTGSFEL